MQLEADAQPGVLGGGELGQAGPVGRDLLLPLPLVDALQVRQPAAGPEVRHLVAGGAARAAGQRDHPVHAEQRGQPDGVTQRPVVLAGQVLVGMQRVAPGVQRVDLQPVPGDGGQPGRPGLAAGEQARHVAVRVRRIATRADLELGDLGSGYRQPAQDLLEAASRGTPRAPRRYADPRFAPGYPQPVRGRSPGPGRRRSYPFSLLPWTRSSADSLDRPSGGYDLSRACENVWTSWNTELETGQPDDSLASRLPRRGAAIR